MSKTFIIAELSANHNHNLKTAIDSIKAAASIGVDAVKIQTYTADTLTLTPETNFRDLDEWSSLSALGVIALADEEFDVELSAAEIRKANTIQELFDLIINK